MKILLFWPRQLAHGTLTAQHDSLSTVQDGVCYVTCLCAGREGLVLANDSKAQLKSHEIAMGTPQNTSVFDNWCHSTTKRSVACYFINRSGTRSLVNCKALPLPPRPPWMPTSPWHKRHIYQPPWSSSASSSEPSTLSP